MQQQEYLTRLKARLISVLPNKETEEIIADYREYFSSAISDGKNEEVVCAELGLPEGLAASIINETGTEETDKPGNKVYRQIIRAACIAALILGTPMLVFGGAFTWFSDEMTLVINIFSFVLVPVLAFYASDGGKYFFGGAEIKHYKALLALCFVPLIFAAVYYVDNRGAKYLSTFTDIVDMNDSIFILAEKFVVTIDYYELGKFLSANLFLFKTVFICLAAAAFIYGLKHRTKGIILTYAALGLAMQISAVMNQLGRLHDTNVEFFINLILNPFWWLLGGIALMFIAAAVLTKVETVSLLRGSKFKKEL